VAQEKVIWVVNYDNLDSFLDKCEDVGATAVAIRTDNDVRKAIPAAHDKGMKVYGWRWPSAMHDPAMNEAAKAEALFNQGMDGYFVDPEQNNADSINWDKRGLEALATEFCQAVSEAARGKPFGLTSHYLANRVAPKLPWAAFLKYATALLPQAYWRTSEGVVGHGIPADNYQMAIASWKAIGGDENIIVPMAGELAMATAAEIAEYVQAARNAPALHFYTYGSNVKASVWAAVKRA
jgi:hypothetical protein